ncbi:ABC transporter ATP-binding protein [Corynebacterium pacaense]|uniref:ABC transporter ATP-binding protein n=1 Tax=Corynebacterium pacaense TaxID=1816684 RepID=UPI0009BBFE59|nr:ABC transporter ATP-binding protein [Corynebacterium pacaense]
MLQTESVRMGYGERTVVRELTLEIPQGGFSVIVGPNGCGKSTVLRTLGRMLRPQAGRVLIDARDIRSLRTREVARRIGLLPQSPHAPDGVTVADLVGRGRYPHQRIWRQWSREDERIVAQSLEEVGLLDCADRAVSELSGGQRQRAWIAMALAQQTPILLLDEPTTYLDIAHQISVLDLCSTLHEQGRTLVMVLHDLNMAARYATHVIAMRDGGIIRQGRPEDVFTETMLRDVFDLDASILKDPNNGRPLIVPKDRRNQ